MADDQPLGMALAEAIERARLDRKARTERALNEPGVTRARFPGRCVCNRPYPAGVPVRKHQDGWQNMLCCGEST
jgi:hypothetical protein